MGTLVVENIYLYNQGYLGKFYYEKNENKPVNNNDNNSNNKQDKKEEEKARILELINKYSYLIENIHLDTKSEYLTEYYSGNLTNELKEHLAFSLINNSNNSSDESSSYFDAELLKNADVDIEDSQLKNMENIKIYFDKGVGVLNLFAFPIFMAILLLGYDAVTFVFQRGAFDSNATLMVTQALLFLSLAILPYIFRDTVTRIYYAFNDSKTPFLVALSSVLLKLIINALLIDKLNIGAITLSTSFVTLFNGAVLGFLLRKKIRLYYDRYFRQLLKMFLSALVAGVISGIIYLVWFVDRSNTLLLFIKLIVMLFVIFGLYLAAGMHYKVEYILILYERLRNKINGYIRR